jgi:hypothetical protein
MKVKWAIFLINFIHAHAVHFKRRFLNRREVQVQTLNQAAQVEYEWITPTLHLILYINLNSLGQPEECSFSLHIVNPKTGTFDPRTLVCNAAFADNDTRRIHYELVTRSIN